MAAINRFPVDPGKCRRPGCGRLLMACKLEERKGKDQPHPPLRFACPACDVWLGWCFDEGYPEDKDYPHGLYYAALRDPIDPWWAWVPENLRAAVAASGFTAAHPHVRIGAFNGRTWATDGKTMLVIGDASEAALAIDRLDVEVLPASKKAEEIQRWYVFKESWIATALSQFVPKRYRPVVSAGMGDLVACGDATIPGRIFMLIEQAHPSCIWFAANKLDPVFAFSYGAGEAIASVMPTGTLEERRAVAASGWAVGV